jgi:hypothetical protein
MMVTLQCRKCGRTMTLNDFRFWQLTRRKLRVNCRMLRESGIPYRCDWWVMNNQYGKWPFAAR